MKNKKYLIFSLLLLSGWACTKSEDQPTPTPVTPKIFSGCRIIESSKTYKTDPDLLLIHTYTYDSAGLINFSGVWEQSISKNIRTSKGGTERYTYQDGLLVALEESDGWKESFEYKNGALSRITIPVDANKRWLDYEIKIENNVDNKIIKLTDYATIIDIQRDANNNIIVLKQTNIATNKEERRMEYSDYDGKKSKDNLFKGWPYDVSNFIDEYMLNPHFSSGTGGNPRQIIEYKEGKLEAKYLLSYEYSTNGYPIKTQITNMVTQSSVISDTYKLVDCN